MQCRAHMLFEHSPNARFAAMPFCPSALETVIEVADFEA